MFPYIFIYYLFGSVWLWFLPLSQISVSQKHGQVLGKSRGHRSSGKWHLFVLDCGMSEDWSRNSSPVHESCISRTAASSSLASSSVTSSLLIGMSSMMAAIGLGGDIRGTKYPVQVQPLRVVRPTPPAVETQISSSQIIRSSPSYQKNLQPTR